KRRAGAALPSPENKKADDGEKKDGRPGDEAVVGGEEHIEEGGGEPEPVAERDVAGFERASVDDVTRDESGKEADEENGGEECMVEEKFRDARGGIWRGE